MIFPTDDLMATVYLALWNAAGQIDPDNQQAKLCELLRTADDEHDSEKYAAQIFVEQELDGIL